jgi:hypothetical protein
MNSIVATAARCLAKARRRHTSWTAAMHAVKYNKAATQERDFREELCEFFGAKEEDLQELEQQKGSFSSRDFQLFVYAFFDGHTADDRDLFKAYSEAAFYYSIMLGIGCPRYATLFPFLEHVVNSTKGLGRRPVAVDYGCGVGDTAILLGSYGFDVHVVDLPDRKTEFALWRLKRRGYHPKWIPVTADDPYPCLPKPTDVVVTIEVWEHLRDPIKALENINQSTVPGLSHLMNTNINFDYEPEGDHLKQGIDLGRSSEYVSLYSRSWRSLKIEAPDGQLYVRI